MPAGVRWGIAAATVVAVVAGALLPAETAAADCVTVTIVNDDGDIVEVTRCTDDDGNASGSENGSGEGAAPGGGAGGSSNCQWLPAVEGIDGTVVSSVYQRTRDDGVIETRYFTDCGDPRWLWVPVGTDPSNFVPQVTPQMLIPEAFDRVRRQLPTPIPHIAPADLAPDGYAFVQMPAFFWVDQGQWTPVSATSALGGLSVTVTATPAFLVVNTGDGETLQCASAPPYREGTDPEQFEGCEHVYTNSSAMAPNGETFAVTVMIVWYTFWRASTGESGTLQRLTTSASRNLPVAEIQAVMVDG